MGYTAAQLCGGSSCRSRCPVIIGGLRIATVTTIGLVTVAALHRRRAGWAS